jgi:hypothetical protein
MSWKVLKEFKTKKHRVQLIESDVFDKTDMFLVNISQRIKKSTFFPDG